MCGITGIINFRGEPVSPATLRKMTDAIVHRGPDGEGFFIDRCAGLGHRRLSIIDLSPAGHQPMISADGRFAVTYNGEVYNFQTLRIELESLGHQFHSKTDSEVVLHSFIEWGEKCVLRFNGMFAFAIWDKIQQELFLARDRYGIKPLYYCFLESTFLFGSEQKALLAHPSFKPELDLEALLEYFTFQNLFTEKTFFKGVKILPAGHFVTLSLPSEVSPSTPLFSPTRYWDFHFVEPEKPETDQDYLEELDRLFRQSVNRQLVSDVDLGAYLSGGMDSGSITAIAALQLPYMKTFTVGFDLHSASGLELAFDERKQAELMSYLFKTEHYEMVLKAGDMERCLHQIAWCIEEPRVGQSYPNYYAAKLASKFVKVVLSGAGGDELFAGYPWRYYRAAVNENFEQYIDKYYSFWQRLIPNKAIQRVFRPVWDNVKHIGTREIFHNVFKTHSEKLVRPVDYINHSLYFEAKTFLHGLLVVEDKLSMANSLETRVPFLDNDLVDFALRVPVSLKLKNLSEIERLNENEPGSKSQKYFQKTSDGKLIVRKVMKNYVPESILSATKQGFSAPDASWFKGESIDYVRSLIFEKNSKLYRFFDAPAVQELVLEHLEGRQNRRLFVWSLINFEHFLRNFSL